MSIKFNLPLQPVGIQIHFSSCFDIKQSLDKLNRHSWKR